MHRIMHGAVARCHSCAAGQAFAAWAQQRPRQSALHCVPRACSSRTGGGVTEDDKQRALSRAARFVQTRLRTVGEVRLKLLEEEHSAGAAAHAVAELQRLRVLDDAAYARLFASNKLRTAHWGRFRLRQALLQKHVAPDDADAALDHLFAATDEDDEDGEALLADPDVMSPAERHDALLDAARRQWRMSARSATAQETRIRRLSGWLSRRGHDYRTVDVIVRQLVKEDGQDATWQDSDG
jgi:regulatory protein